MISSHIGELAALATAVCWTISSFSFQAAGARLGALVVNLMRLLIALPCVALLCWAVRGQPLPLDASADAWFWLGLSAVTGQFLGGMCLYRAYLLIGPRLATLIMSLAPPLTALVSWLTLGETLTVRDIIAIGITIAGVAVAVTERNAPPAAAADGSESAPAQPALSPTHADRQRGVLLSVVASFTQAASWALSKQGLGDYSALAGGQIRIIAAIASFSLLFTFIGWWPRVAAALPQRAGIGFTALGAITGPVCGTTLSLYAVQHTKTGIASSIMAITPVLMIPVVAILYKERVTWRGVLATIVAFLGVALLF